jgi:hypothetical protein
MLSVTNPSVPILNVTLVSVFMLSVNLQSTMLRVIMPSDAILSDTNLVCHYAEC